MEKNWGDTPSATLIISENGNMLGKKGVNVEHLYESMPTSSSLYWKFINSYKH